jgi:outer membrane protein TolC
MRLLHALALTLALSSVSHAAGALTFEEAEKAMLAANPQAVSASLDLEASRSRVTAARAGFYPSFFANASYSRSGSQGLPAGDSYGYGVSGSQPLFSPSVPVALRSAKASLRSAEASYDRTASGLRYQLKSVFADILNARETIKLSEETLKRRAENLELIRLKYQAGRENKAALLETEAALKTAQWQHERYRKNLRLLERKLNRLLGRAAQAPAPELALALPPAPPEDLSGFAQRLKNHYALRSARAALDSAGASVTGASGARLPDASATGSYHWGGSDWPAALNSWSLGASLSLPLFSGGRLSSNLSAAKAALRSSEADLRNAEDEVHLNAEDAFLSWREASSYMGVAKSSLDAAEARAWLVRKQYLAGQASYFEWRNVEEQLISEQNQYLAANRGLITSHAAFVQALGD